MFRSIGKIHLRSEFGLPYLITCFVFIVLRLILNSFSYLFFMLCNIHVVFPPVSLLFFIWHPALRLYPLYDSSSFTELQSCNLSHLRFPLDLSRSCALIFPTMPHFLVLNLHRPQAMVICYHLWAEGALCPRTAHVGRKYSQGFVQVLLWLVRSALTSFCDFKWPLRSQPKCLAILYACARRVLQTLMALPRIVPCREATRDRVPELRRRLQCVVLPSRLCLGTATVTPWTTLWPDPRSATGRQRSTSRPRPPGTWDTLGQGNKLHYVWKICSGGDAWEDTARFGEEAYERRELPNGLLRRSKFWCNRCQEQRNQWSSAFCEGSSDRWKNQLTGLRSLAARTCTCGAYFWHRHACSADNMALEIDVGKVKVRRSKKSACWFAFQSYLGPFNLKSCVKHSEAFLKF